MLRDARSGGLRRATGRDAKGGAGADGGSEKSCQPGCERGAVKDRTLGLTLFETLRAFNADLKVVLVPSYSGDAEKIEQSGHAYLCAVPGAGVLVGGS
jgi:hypothetical protein